AAELGFVKSSDLVRDPGERARVIQSMKGERPPKLGALGCCGLGCNGCLPFWNDEKYARARATLAQKKGLMKLPSSSIAPPLNAPSGNLGPITATLVPPATAVLNCRTE